MSENHPYKTLMSLYAWDVIEKTLNDLGRNQDLVLQTSKEYVIGYLLQELINAEIISDDSTGR